MMSHGGTDQPQAIFAVGSLERPGAGVGVRELDVGSRHAIGWRWVRDGR